VDFSRTGLLCGEILYKKHLAFGTTEGLVVMPEMSGGKEDLVIFT
jgi:hypothetical protein